MSELNGYQLSRQWFDFCFDNPEKIKPIHTAIYFFAIEHCNRLGWKKKFGFPTQMAMEAIGIKNWRTYNKAFTDLVDWGFLELIEKSKNQYSSCIICLCKKYNSTVGSPTKSLDKALQKHAQKQVNSTVGINKQETKEQGTKEQGTKEQYEEKYSIESDYEWDGNQPIDYDSFVDYFNEVTGGACRMTNNKRPDIKKQIKVFTGNEIKQALDKRAKSLSDSQYLTSWESIFTRKVERMEKYLTMKANGQSQNEKIDFGI